MVFSGEVIRSSYRWTITEFLSVADVEKSQLNVASFLHCLIKKDLFGTQFNATGFRFDASDIMPAAVGAGSFWTGMVDWIAANGENTDEVLQAIDDSWPS